MPPVCKRLDDFRDCQQRDVLASLCARSNRLELDGCCNFLLDLTIQLRFNRDRSSGYSCEINAFLFAFHSTELTKGQIVFLGIFGLFTAKLLIDFKLNHPNVHTMFVTAGFYCDCAKNVLTSAIQG